MSQRSRVAIIGAGIAGLVCAYELGKRGIESTVFEAENRCGGRIRSALIDGAAIPVGAIMFTPDYSSFLKLLREMKLEDAIERIPLSKSALLFRDKAVALNKLSLLRTSALSLRTKLEIRKLWDRVSSIPAWSYDENLMQVSLTDYLEGIVSEETIELIVGPAINAFFQRPEEIAAAVGLQMLKSLPKVHVLAGGNVKLIDTLKSTLHESLRLKAEVKGATYEGGRWQLDIHSPEPVQSEFDFLVCTAPLDQSRTMFPNGKIQPLTYAPVHVLVVKGDYMFKKHRILIDTDWKDSEIHSIKNFGSLQVIHARTPSPKLETFYNNHQVIHKVHWDRALPLIKPGTKFQSIETGLPNFYLAGDFYLGGRMESAVRAAEAVADKIVRTRLGSR